MKQRKQKTEWYAYIRAILTDGRLRWEYRLADGPPGRMSHDEDVSEWTHAEIVGLTRSMLSVDGDDLVTVEVVYD
jgi:hypothetical protein